MTQGRFAATHLLDDTLLCLAWGADDRLAGFYNLNVMHLEACGEPVTVITAGLFTRLEYAAARPLKRNGFFDVIRARARHPRGKLAFVPVATTPVAYRSVGLDLPIYYPHPDRTPPAYVVPALHEMCRRRSLVPDQTNPFVVEFFAQQRRIDQLWSTRTMKDPDPMMRYFMSSVPEWGHRQALLVWIPWDYANVLGSAIRLPFRRRKKPT